MVLRGTRLIIEKAHPPPKDKNSISHIGCLLFTRIIKQEKGQKQCFFMFLKAVDLHVLFFTKKSGMNFNGLNKNLHPPIFCHTKALHTVPVHETVS